MQFNIAIRKIIVELNIGDMVWQKWCAEYGEVAAMAASQKG
jgi:hypothetical protein